MHGLHRTRPLAGLALALLAQAATAQTLDVRPGLWAQDTQIWINGQPLSPGLDALRQKIRSRLTEAQRQQFDRESGADKTACLSADEARVDLNAFVQQALADQGPWACSLAGARLDAGSFKADFRCTTSGGGHQQGRVTATFDAKSYRMELNGRGNAVDRRTGEALPVADVDSRLVSTGRWLGASCTGG